MRGGHGYSQYLRFGNSGAKDVFVEKVTVELDNRSPWTYLPATREVPVVGKVPAGGSLDLPVTLLDAMLSSDMVDGQGPVAEAGAQFPLRLRLTAKGSTTDGTAVDSVNGVIFTVTIANQLLDAPCPGQMQAEGCSIVNVDTASGTA